MMLAHLNSPLLTALLCTSVASGCTSISARSSRYYNVNSVETHVDDRRQQSEFRLRLLRSDFSPQNKPEVTPLRLRGGFTKCFSCCCGGNEDHLVVEDHNQTTAGTTEPAAKRRKIGKMESSVDIKASKRKVYRVVSDIEHYQDWSGDGLRSIKLVENGQGYVVADYVCGAFGLTFHFAMVWGLSPPDSVSFRNSGPTGFIQMLRGKYTLSSKSEDVTNVNFHIEADMTGPIPHIIKIAIAKLLVHIALNDLKSYVESPRCDANLARYDAGMSLAQRLTRFYTEVPNFVLRQNYSRLALQCLQAAAGLVLLRRAVLR